MINRFVDEYYFLSNFYECPVEYNGIVYGNNEAAFQAQKTMDKNLRYQFSRLNPIDARKIGNLIAVLKGSSVSPIL